MPARPLTILAALCLAACAAEAPAPPFAVDESGWRIAPEGDLNGLFDCLREQGASLVVAHRGGPRPGFPENALETMARTLTIGPTILEIDLSESADGVVFLHHDETLDRTTTGAGPAIDRRWRDIAALNLRDETGAATRFSPTRFDDALAWAEGRTVLKLDFKRSARYENVAAIVKDQHAEDRVILIAYTLAQAQKLRRLLPETMISLNIEAVSDFNRAVAGGAPPERLIAFTGVEAPDPNLNAFLDARLIEVDFGALGARKNWRYDEIAAAGVHLLTVDRPGEALRALAAAGRAARGGACGIAERP